MKPKKEEIFAERYYAKHGIKSYWLHFQSKESLDETSSFFLDPKKKGQKI